jgi:hypothetical protein
MLPSRNRSRPRFLDSLNEAVHFPRRFVKNYALGVPHYPIRAHKSRIQGGPHIQFLAVVPLHLPHHFVIARKSWMRRGDTFCFVNSKERSWFCGLRPQIQRRARRFEMRQQESTE